MYLWLADVIALFHGLVVLTVVLGTAALLAGRWSRVPRPWRCVYAAAMLGMVISQALWGDCILTVWEKDLRNLDRDGSAYRESFIGHYLPWLPAPVLGVIGPLLVAAAAVRVAWDWRKGRGRERPAPSMAPQVRD